MAKFLFEYKELEFDFQFFLRNAISFQNWKNGKEEHSIIYPNFDNLQDIQHIPIGSVEFVDNFLNYHFNITPKPIQIPNALFEDYFLKRKCDIVNKNNIPIGYFYKGLDRYKDVTGIYEGLDRYKDVNEGEGEDKKYFISEVFHIDSEYRVFVHKNKMVGLKHYVGDYTLFPDIEFILKAITSYRDMGNPPVAYTLDIAINRETGNHYLLEIHDFYSVGLYGFQEYNKIPQMFSQWYFEFLNNNKNG